MSLASKDVARNSARRKGKEIVIPFFDALNFLQIFAGVLMSNDFGARFVEPGIAVGVIKVPMRIDEVRNRVGSESGKGLGHLRARYADAGIDQHLAIAPGNHGDISAGTFKHTDIAAKRVSVDGRGRSAIFNEADDTSGFSEGLVRRKPTASQPWQLRRDSKDRNYVARWSDSSNAS